jgi:hypothetical protein
MMLYYSSSRIWKFSNMYAGHIWIYLIAFLAAVLASYIQLDKNVLNLQATIQDAALHAATWGIFGGILRCLWHQKDHVSNRRYRNSYNIYFTSAPFIGGIIGALVYLLIAGIWILFGVARTHLCNYGNNFYFCRV